MAFAISEFKSNLRGGGARPSLFRVEFQYPSGITKPNPPNQAKFLIKATNCFKDESISPSLMKI